MFLSQVWWCKFVIQALRGLKQEDHKLRKKRRRRREKRKKEGRKKERKGVSYKLRHRIFPVINKNTQKA
jgi:hypothetical protein